ncbi:MAG TPA: hypothetical protein VN814_06750 [Caulobacteraceae bacterium]|nr:hypothetical protein [Caulobacteraceae bacterium]
MSIGAASGILVVSKGTFGTSPYAVFLSVDGEAGGRRVLQPAHFRRAGTVASQKATPSRET